MSRTMAGIILTMQNKEAEARKEYELALAADPQAAVAANNLSWVLADKGEQLDTALQLAQTAKSHMPESGDVSDTLGWIYYKKGLTSLAVSELRQAVARSPASAVVHYHLGLAELKNGGRADARKALEQALKLDPTFSNADDAKRVLSTLAG